MTVEKISVIIIADHPVIRHGVTSVLKKQPDMNVVCESHNADARQTTSRAIT